MLKVYILAFLFLCNTLVTIDGAETYLTQPPKGWECIQDPSQLPRKVKVIYIGKGVGKNPFTPSINVACEETVMPIDEYVAIAKAYHEGQSGTHCANLGKIKTDAGTIELLQIDRPTQWGEVRFIQGMLVNSGQAYVITATCLKNEFSTLSTQIFKAIQSFSLKI